jgi:hypothetical protein
MNRKLLSSLMLAVMIITLVPGSSVKARSIPAMASAEAGAMQAGDTMIASYDYTYYPSGNVNTIAEDNGHGIQQTQTFEYDAANRLSRAQAETTVGSAAGQGDYALRNYPHPGWGLPVRLSRAAGQRGRYGDDGL